MRDRLTASQILHRKLHSNLAGVADADGPDAGARVGDEGEAPLVEQVFREEGQLAGDGQPVGVLEFPAGARIDDHGVVDMAGRRVGQIAVAIEGRKKSPRFSE